MLVKFHSSTSGEILMFADAARPILAALDKRATARGVMTAEELPALIERLDRALARWRGERAAGGDPGGEGGEGGAPQVSLAQRAVPLRDLLARTRDDDGYVLWQAAADFAAA